MLWIPASAGMTTEKEQIMSVPMQTETITARREQTRQAPLTVKDFKGKAEPDWCPGCGDFGVLVAIKQALVDLGVRPHEAMVISGIGCSSNLPGYISTYGMHTLHGRALAVATGAQLANHDLRSSLPGATATATASAAIISCTPCAATST